MPSRSPHLALLGLTTLLLPAAADAATRQIFLWYPDGETPPASVRKICPSGTPPAFNCRSGPDVDACRREVQTQLDRWYADFDAVFTYDVPADGVYDTVVVASDGAWCSGDPRTESRSPLVTCNDSPGGSVAIFTCGQDAKRCATLIAKEQAHLVGLQHTGSTQDVMSSELSADHMGFEDAMNRTSSSGCPVQNSYRLMLERLGPWTGGPKPAPTPPAPRTEPPPNDAGPAEPDAAPAPDAAAEVLPPPGKDAEAAAPESDSGCGCRVGGLAAGNPGSSPWLALAIMSWFLRRRRR
jgi:hypothetical protein